MFTVTNDTAAEVRRFTTILATFASTLWYIHLDGYK